MVDVLSHYIDVALLIVALYLIYRGVTSPKRGLWDAHRITAAIISVLIVALAAVVYLGADLDQLRTRTAQSRE